MAGAGPAAFARSVAVLFGVSEMLVAEVVAIDSFGDSPATVDRAALKVASDAEVDGEHDGLEG